MEVPRVEREFSRVRREFSRVQREFSRVQREISRVQREFSRVQREISRGQREFPRVGMELFLAKVEFSRASGVPPRGQMEVFLSLPEVYRSEMEILRVRWEIPSYRPGGFAQNAKARVRDATPHGRGRGSPSQRGQTIARARCVITAPCGICNSLNGTAPRRVSYIRSGTRIPKSARP